MKRFFKYIGLALFAVIFALYLEFIFVLPRTVDLNVFKWELQKIVKEQTKLDINFENAKLITTPLLGIGISADAISVNLPDKTPVFSADSFKTKLSLPSLALLTVKVTGTEIENPKINLEIADGKQFKIVSLIESILNEQEDNLVVKTTPPPVIDPSLIRIKVPAIKITNYNALVNDLKSGHKLVLKGDELILGYNVNKVRIKTDAEFYSDEDKNIEAEIDIDTILPPMDGLDADDDPAQRIEFPFINPVLTYRDYNLKSDIDAKLKIREWNNTPHIFGHIKIDDTTMELSGLKLPESTAGIKFNGTKAFINTNLYVTNNQNIKLKGQANYGKKPAIDLSILSSKIYFNDIQKLTKALLDTLQVKNELALLQTSGYFTANADIKTDFKKLQSNGSIIVRDGNITNQKAGLSIKDMRANVIFKDNLLEIKDTVGNVNGAKVVTSGSIDDQSNINISIHTKNLPLGGLYRTFAPVELKNAYAMNSGNLTLNTNITGELKNAAGKINLVLDNLSITDKKSLMGITDNSLEVDLESDFKNIFGNITNRDLRITIPQTSSVLYNPLLILDITDKDININRTEIKLNNSSFIRIYGQILDYMKSQNIAVTADGTFNTADLKQLAGKDAALFIDAKGKIPLKFAFKGNPKKQTVICQLISDSANFITPVNINSLVGRQTIFQGKVDLKGNRLRIKDTGIFAKIPDIISEDFDENIRGAKEIAGVSGTITNLNSVPFINLIRISIPQELHMDISAFKDSSLTLDGGLLIFGNSNAPRTRGNFRVRNLSIPDLFLTARESILAFKGKSLDVNIDDMFINGSDMRIYTNISLNPSPVAVINNLTLNSDNINVDRLMRVSEAAAKFTPPAAPNSAPANIPVTIRNGSINIGRIVSGAITALRTTGRISLRNNVFYLNNLNSNAIGGNVRGNISANLVSTLMRIQVRGSNFDVEEALLVLANMKDTLAGTLGFRTDISLSGTTMEEQMKTLSGTVDFHIEEGQLGPFGKFENFLLAENIRESEFFQTTIGAVINSMTTVETSHYELLSGHLDFKDGVVTLNPIASLGKVMCLHIAGTMNLLTNEADMKIRGKLASQISDMLGPVAAVNPVNLVKVTPGLNVVAAKTFTLFCESVTQEEMDAIPDFEKDYNVMSTTKFQVVLRGNVEKPLSLVKSFKWLALQSEIDQAQAFVATLPENQEEFIKQQNPTKWEKFIRFFKRKDNAS